MKVHKFNSLLVFVLHFAIHGVSAQDVKCSEAFCKNYQSSVGCPVLAIECRAQNETHNGALLDSPIPCTCCQTCIIHLKENEECSIGRPGAPAPKYICGPALYCHDDVPGEHPICKPMHQSSKCYTKQKDYDDKEKKGELGSLMVRPKCDGSGNYQPVHCTPGQICYCLSKDGDRIFGEAATTNMAELMMKCECARLHATSSALLGRRLRPVQSLRCAPDGSYDELQCIRDSCNCVYGVTGDPVSVAVNMTTQGLSKLDCFDPKEHSNTSYVRACEDEQLAELQEILKFEQTGYSVLEFPLQSCQPDGRYGPVRVRQDRKICVDKFGDQIEKYEAPLKSPQGKMMNCKCARTRLLLSKAGSKNPPTCCENGNYQSGICADGKCWCLDEDGNQTTKEVAENEKDTLVCFQINGGAVC